MVKIGACDLCVKPRVAVAVRDGLSNEQIKCLVANADIVEFRIDLFEDKSATNLLHEARKFADFPKLGTIRAAFEGGAWDESEAKRLELFRLILPEIDAVDIELSAEDISGDVVHDARDSGKTIIGSFHHFTETPEIEVLNRVVQQGRQLGVDIIKIAAHCRSAEDLKVLSRFLLNHPDVNLIVLGMGVAGIPSRVLFPGLGSLITYTFLGNPSAPGQLSLSETRRILDLLYPSGI